MAFLPEVIVEVPEAEAAASGLLAWLGRFGVLSGAGSLLSRLFGTHNPEPATGNAMRPVVDLLAYPQRAIYIMLFYVNTVLDHLGRALARAHTVTRTWVYQERLARLVQVAQLAYNTRAAIYQERLARLVQVAQLARNVAVGLYQERLARFQQVAGAVAEARAATAALRAQAAGWVDQEAASRFRADVITQATDQAYTRQLVGNEAIARHDALVRQRAAINADVIQPTRAAWPQIVAELTAAGVAAGPDLAGLRNLISAVPTTAPSTLAGAAADPLAVTRVLTKALTDCTVPNCRNLGKYGRDLAGLGTLLGAAGLLAFLVYAVEHPDEAARETQHTAGALIDGIVHEVEHLLGV